MAEHRFTVGPETYQRAVSPQEWAHQANPAGAAMTIQLFVEGTGRIDAAELARAVAVAAEALPGTRLRRRGRVWADSGRPPRVRELNGAGLDRASLSVPGLYRPLRGDRGGALNEVILLSGGQPAVLFRSHHSVMDGKGLLCWAAAVFTALRGEPVEAAPGIESGMALARRIGVPGHVSQERGKVRPVLRSRRSFARRGKLVRRRVLPGNHPAVIAKLATAVNAVLELDHASFLVTVDLRRHDPDLRSTGNLVGAVNLWLEAGATWQQAQARLLELLGERAELAMLAAEDAERVLGVPLPVLRPAMRIMDTLAARRAESDFTAVMSHWGQLDLADFATDGFQPHTVFAVPQPGYFLPATFTLVELPGRTEIVFTCDGGPGAAERAERLLDDVVAALSGGSARPVNIAGEPEPGSPLELIRAHAGRDPRAVALLEPDGLSLNYGQLEQHVCALVRSLRGLGVGPRGRVAAIVSDGLDAAVLFLAAATAAVFSPLNPAYSAQELERAFDDLAPALLIVNPGLSVAARALAVERGIPVAEFDRADGAFRLVAGSGGASGSIPVPDAGESLLLQTSGTAGQSKLVPLTWSTMLAGARASGRAYRLEAADRRLNIMPLFHVQGLVGSVLASLACGSSVLCASAPRPEDIPGWLERYEVTWFSASPLMHERILDRAEDCWRPLESLRFVRSGSAALPPALRERLEARYQVPVVESYGMTEAHQIASTPLEVGDTAMVPTGSEVGLLTDGEITTRSGVRGEIVVRGGNVVTCYHSPARANVESFTDGWFRTGDEGELTEDGRLRITGRIKDLIIRGGEKVSPLEVESVLARHPAIRQVAVCGVSDAQITEQVAAVVVLRDGMSVTEAELRRFARASLAPYKVPTIIEYRGELATTKGDKVSRAALARELGAAGHTQLEAASSRTADEPRTPTEKEVARIWVRTLGLPAVGVHDDFFVLGGQSLDGLALIATVNADLDAHIEPLALFDQANTIARMARLIDRRRLATREEVS